MSTTIAGWHHVKSNKTTRCPRCRRRAKKSGEMWAHREVAPNYFKPFKAAETFYCPSSKLTFAIDL